MKKILLILLCNLLFARENPFLPKINKEIKTENTNSYNNIVFKIPTNAKQIDDLLIFYTDKNGKKIQQKIKINKNIADNNSYIALNFLEIFEDVTFIDNTDTQKTNNLEQNTALKYNLGNSSIINLENNTIQIVTNNSIKRHFTLNNPFRIVIDFDKSKNLKYVKHNINKYNIKEIYTGVHKDFYRIVIRLNKVYNYDLKKDKPKYTITIKEKE